MDDARREYSLNRLTALTDRLASPADKVANRLCVYATGSYGRLEAGTDSDIDLFFLCDADSDDAFPFALFVRVAAAIVEATEEMGFPPFTGDGEYLEVHYVQRMEDVLGSRADDSINAFTARMLLLLESRPVLAPEIYERLLQRVVSFSFRDFADHPDFLPIFLTNDILRFWRTLTLNYEHSRLKLRSLEGDALRTEKAESALKNYKLKINRLLTCFSMIAVLASRPAPVTEADVLALCEQTPRARLRSLGHHGAGASDLVDDLRDATKPSCNLCSAQRPSCSSSSRIRSDGRRPSPTPASSAI